MLNRRLAFASLAVTLLLAATGLAHATGSPLGIGTAEPSFQPIGGPLAPIFLYVNDQQQAFYRALTQSIGAMRKDPWQLSTLIGLSFAYGIFHAAGPGHGKAVISSYMVANEIQLKRGIAISFVSAFVQGVVAVAVVGAAYFVLRGSGITMTEATNAMEISSFVMVILFGCWLLFRKLRSMMRAMPERRMEMATLAGPVSVALFDSGAFARNDATVASAGQFNCDAPTLGTAGVVCEDCGRAHLPDPLLLKAEHFSAREAWSAIVAVGLRPCSGALLVMTFAMLNGLLLGGVLSVFAMSLGTAITVSMLAIMAVTAKGLAMRLAGPGSAKSTWVGNGIELLGAVFVIVTGIVLLGASLQT
ncbi:MULTISPECIES: nickel/cobalt transporter [unclassified Rhizobium]|uniref:nickel/cobalt transporter n=1 Tax=unclassified Rhizobium TaxID=2613769 RepID=UPI001ADA17D5|nr:MULTISPECIES: nickel/cobalt transporter [unclassified Rhizobium]MBO9099792.1 nickel/cobalt transporter [Rhizobium sp. L58/93]MBO9131665.1 nickel/cobalt transporter [Rhizobium sp. B209b/85]MBO9169781.1 nickel/cobalt transporter [Rhizobium sp. L245/93]MBO9185739.1 nickel/cobalt transporter [Rhizobium sp. E27B/91]QXZ82502.1 nickel/cobalt transporter [Rhizobium sp. K1/93]